jgi:hypothetical protein
VWTYGGSADVRRTFGADLISIKDVADRPIRVETRARKVSDGAGGLVDSPFQMPIWFDAVASGQTPMHAAFQAVVAPIRNWIGRHPSSFPPIVLNLTDGMYSDLSPAAVVGELTQMATADGNVLVFNCHISEKPGASVAFPGDTQAAALSGLARELFDMSSMLPDPMRRQAEAKGYSGDSGVRGYAFNADLVTMIDFLDIGTRAIQDRVEAA